ncbi:MAG TPA: ribonuclease Z [Gaiellaceae bacterium]|nr:ribonuclease Z [Gaiellaceae bacterium]
MDLDVVFLGTAASMPTARRGPSALLVRRGGERLLFDCGEGTQRQLQRSVVGLPDLEEIFLTHYHADHFLGLPGMLKTFDLRGRDETPLTVYGPSGLRDLFKRLQPFIGRLQYPVTLLELEPGETVERDGYSIGTFAVEHGRAAVGYALVERERPGRFDVAAADALGVPAPSRGRLQAGEEVTLEDGRRVQPAEVLGEPRPGRTIVITGDTGPAPSVVQAADGADLLVHEASFLAEEAERARETNHSTAAEAAEVARLAQVRLLALTHVSPRYFGPELAEEASAVFAETVVPRDFDVIEVPFAERGAPRLVERGARPPRPMIEKE